MVGRKARQPLRWKATLGCQVRPNPSPREGEAVMWLGLARSSTSYTPRVPRPPVQEALWSVEPPPCSSGADGGSPPGGARGECECVVRCEFTVAQVMEDPQ